MSSASSVVTFGSYRLDLENVRVWNGDRPIHLQPRPLAVLCYLAARPGVVVGRTELLERLWADAHVTGAVVKVAVRAIRHALRDDPRAPRYIQTVGRHGYRFVGTQSLQGPPSRSAVPAMVGRLSNLVALRAAFQRAAGGISTAVVVTGEPGIGKSTLIEQFLVELAGDDQALVARGRCPDQFGQSEAYLPIIEALARLLRSPFASECETVLSHHAPMWLRELPPRDFGAGSLVEVRAADLTPGRLVRELADALEVLAATRVVVLVIEDLHWCDPSTAALIPYLIRRRETARLLIIGSARTGEPGVGGARDPRRKLLASGLVLEMPLELLSLEEVTAYVANRLAGMPASTVQTVARQIHRHTEGNPLFMVNMITDAVDRGVIVRCEHEWLLQAAAERFAESLPASLREMIRHRIAGLSVSSRRALEVASVAGDEFTSAEVAAALDRSEEAIESALDRLTDGGGLIVGLGAADWAGGVTSRYRFLHSLYRRVLYESISAGRRVRLHRSIGAAQLAGLGDRVNDRAGQLAWHFSLGHDDANALEFHERAGFAALDRQATQEGALHLNAALEVLERIDAQGAGSERGLRLVMARANLSMALHGYASTAAELDLGRAQVLCDVPPKDGELAAVLRGLVSFHHVRGALNEAKEIGERLLRLADRLGDPAARVQAHYGHGATLFHIGALADAERHLAAALELYRPETHSTHAQVYGGYDPGVAASMWLAWTRALQGRLQEALKLSDLALGMARSLPHPFSFAWACYAASVSRQLFSDWPASEALATESLHIATEHGFAYLAAMAAVNRGWAQVMRGQGAAGVAILREGVERVEATGARLLRPSYLGMLAVSSAMLGDRLAAERYFEEAWSEMVETGERLHEASLLIGKSHFLSVGGVGGRGRRSRNAEAEACLRRARAVARAQGARLLELRAALARMRHCQGRADLAAARKDLEIAYRWFRLRPPLVPEVEHAGQLLGESVRAGVK